LCYVQHRLLVAARYLLARSLAMAPPSFDPMIATPLRINVALGSGDVATALAVAGTIAPIADLWTRPAELATAVGAAHAWAGRAADAGQALAIAVARATTEQRFTAHV